MLIYDWCEERLEIQSIADDILAKFVPAHVNIFYCFGGIMVTSFIFQGGSGFALTIYYQPTVVEAFPSVQLILYHVNVGWFIQSIHRWSSGVMAASSPFPPGCWKVTRLSGAGANSVWGGSNTHVTTVRHHVDNNYYT